LLIDEVDGEKFTKQFSADIKSLLEERMAQSKVVFAMQSMGKQRNKSEDRTNDEVNGHCLEQTGMKLLPLQKSMRMIGNIYNLHKIATESILQSTTITFKHAWHERIHSIEQPNQNYASNQEHVQDNENLP